jgi:hypothetical protein
VAMPGDVVGSTATPPWTTVPGDVVSSAATPPLAFQVRAASPEHQPLGGRTILTEPPPAITQATPQLKPAAVPAAKPSAPVAAAKVTAPPTKKPKKTGKERSRDHRDRWKELASREQAHPRPRPRSVATLRTLTPEAILQPHGGFQTKAQFQVAVGELCVKEGKIVTSSNSTKKGVGPARRRLGNALGCCDRNHVRYVCAGSPTCGFVADAFCRYVPDTGGFSWQCETFFPHTCSWDPSDGSAAVKAGQLRQQLEQHKAMLTAAQELHAQLPTASTAKGIGHCHGAIKALEAEIESAGIAIVPAKASQY